MTAASPTPRASGELGHGRPASWLAALLMLAACSSEERSDRPDVVLISLDSVRADALTFLDAETSPHLAQLAERGTIFTQAISGTSWTLPSHLQMFTGLPPVLHGVQEDDLRLDPRLATLPELLRENDYQSAGFFTCWYLHGEYGFEDGFDLYANSMQGGENLDRALDEAMASDSSLEERRREFRRWKTTNQFVNSPVVVENATRALDEVARDEPLFLFAHFFDPHFDYIPPAPFGTRYDPDYTGSITGVNYWENKRIWDASKTPPRQINDRDLDHIRALYRGEIAWTDDAIGKLLAKLEERGTLDETLIIVTADHGEEFFEHGDRGHRRTLYDEVLRVPLLIVPPKSSTTQVSRLRDEQVSLSDLLPTILDYGGVGDTVPVYGRSLRPAIEGAALESRPLVSSLVIPLEDKQRGQGRGLYDCLRTSDEKIIRMWTQFEGEPRPSLHSLEFFDLQADPLELSPLRSLDEKRVRQAWMKLEREMDAIRADFAAFERTPARELLTQLQAITGEDLAHLGYASVESDPTADPNERLGYQPIPPAAITGGKRQE